MQENQKKPRVFFKKSSKTLSKNHHQNHHPVTQSEVLQKSLKVTKLNDFLIFSKIQKIEKTSSFFNTSSKKNQKIFKKSSKKNQKIFNKFSKNIQKIFKKLSPPNPVITWLFYCFIRFFLQFWNVFSAYQPIILAFSQVSTCSSSCSICFPPPFWRYVWYHDVVFLIMRIEATSQEHQSKICTYINLL